MQSRARRVIDGATICRWWYEDEPRTPMATLGRGSTALPTTTAPLAPFAGWFLRFHAASLLTPLRWHAECRRRCGSFASSDYFHETANPPTRALSLRYCTFCSEPSPRSRELTPWNAWSVSHANTQEKRAKFHRAQSSQGEAIVGSTGYFTSPMMGLEIEWSRNGRRKINGRIWTLYGASVRDSKLTLLYASGPR
jgi:hypothetical protein